MMNSIIEFLKRNGFKEIESNSFANDMGCNVVFEEKGYAVANSEGNAMYSKDFNIYWLIGVLTYYNFIDRLYKNP